MIPNDSLPGFDEAHFRALAESPCNYDYGYVRVMMKAYFSTTVSLEGAAYATTVPTVDSMELLKMAIAYSCSMCAEESRSEQVLRVEDGVEWAEEPLCMQYEFRVARSSSLSAQEIKLGKLNIITSVIVRREGIFEDKMQCLLS